MPIPQSTIKRYATGQPRVRLGSRTARAQGYQTAFLSHSHHDAELAKGLQQFLASAGWHVYIDWEDSSMPESPARETAVKIQQKIVELDWFMLLATENSKKSRWCPWELGYADGKKVHENILIVPTSDAGGSYGNEYLALYRHIDATSAGGFAAFAANARGGGLSLKSLAPR